MPSLGAAHSWDRHSDSAACCSGGLCVSSLLQEELGKSSCHLWITRSRSRSCKAAGVSASFSFESMTLQRGWAGGAGTRNGRCSIPESGRCHFSSFPSRLLTSWWEVYLAVLAPVHHTPYKEKMASGIPCSEALRCLMETNGPRLESTFIKQGREKNILFIYLFMFKLTAEWEMKA